MLRFVFEVWNLIEKVNVNVYYWNDHLDMSAPELELMLDSLTALIYLQSPGKVFPIPCLHEGAARDGSPN